MLRVGITPEERKARIFESIREANGLGFQVSQWPDDQVSVCSTHNCVHHLSTLRAAAFGEGQRFNMVSYVACEVWRPELVCPCGQLRVTWEPSIANGATEG